MSQQVQEKNTHDNTSPPGSSPDVTQAARQSWLNAFSIGIVALYGLQFLLFVHRAGPKDHDQFLVFHELQFWNQALFGLAKQWTPLMCSGLSMAGEPQVPFMSLSMMLSYVFGPLWGLQLATLLYFVAGWSGAYLYAGLWLQPRAQRALAASLFIGNGFFFCRLGFGHIDFIPFLALPMLLWTLHRAIVWSSELTWHGILQLFAVTLLLAGGIAVIIDGSPVAIIHLMFWVGLYALVLSLTARARAPLVMLSGAAMVAMFLDAGYFWPMLESQSMFPRRTPDTFTSFLSLIWFALLPVRGKLLPANGNGHELSVFIGPVLGYLIWRYRTWLSNDLPRDLKRPLLIVSVVSIVLGMGSLKPLHIPTWLSPFDLLRPLPGFRSIGVTGRYWGFLALPLSLLSAAALSRFVFEHRNYRRLRVLLGFALALQLCFQGQTMLAKWLPTPTFQIKAYRQAFQNGPESIDYVTSYPHRQGEFITPTRGVIDCYNMGDFIKAPMHTGRQLVQSELHDDMPLPVQPSAHAGFVTFSHIRLWLDDTFSAPTTPIDSSRLQVVLNQAYHPLWRIRRVDSCEVQRGEHNNLVVDCPLWRWRKGDVDLEFRDVLSTYAAEISMLTWRVWLPTVAVLSLLVFWGRRRARQRVRVPIAAQIRVLTHAKTEVDRSDL